MTPRQYARAPALPGLASPLGGRVPPSEVRYLVRDAASLYGQEVARRLALRALACTSQEEITAFRDALYTAQTHPNPDKRGQEARLWRLSEPLPPASPGMRWGRLLDRHRHPAIWSRDRAETYSAEIRITQDASLRREITTVGPTLEPLHADAGQIRASGLPCAVLVPSWQRVPAGAVVPKEAIVRREGDTALFLGVGLPLPWDTEVFTLWGQGAPAPSGNPVRAHTLTSRRLWVHPSGEVWVEVADWRPSILTEAHTWFSAHPERDVRIRFYAIERSYRIDSYSRGRPRDVIALAFLAKENLKPSKERWVDYIGTVEVLCSLPSPHTAAGRVFLEHPEWQTPGDLLFLPTEAWSHIPDAYLPPGRGYDKEILAGMRWPVMLPWLALGMWLRTLSDSQRRGEVDAINITDRTLDIDEAEADNVAISLQTRDKAVRSGMMRFTVQESLGLSCQAQAAVIGHVPAWDDWSPEAVAVAQAL